MVSFLLTGCNNCYTHAALEIGNGRAVIPTPSGPYTATTYAFQLFVSGNILRRQLDASQRAGVGVRLKKLFAVDAKKRMLKGVRDPEVNSPQGNRAPQARDQATALRCCERSRGTAIPFDADPVGLYRPFDVVPMSW